MFVIALCLTVWAALSWVSGPRRTPADARSTFVPLARSAPAGPVWRAGSSAPATAAAQARSRVHATDTDQAEAVQAVRLPERRNDEFRGANATVTQRPNLDDAFDRFLEQEHKDRR